MRARILRNPKIALGIVLACIILSLAAIYAVYKNGVEVPASDNRSVREVKTASIFSLSEESTPLSLVGEVRSKSEAELRAEKGGQIVRVYTSAGAYVGAGAVLAEVEHQAESAAVLQAKGALLAAEAALAKARAGARAEDAGIASSGSQSAALSLTEAENAARNAYRGAFTLAQDALFAKADTLFSNSQTVRPNFIPISPNNTEALALENERVALGEELARWQEETLTLSPTNTIEPILGSTRVRLERMKKFLDQIAYFVGTQKVGGTVTTESIAAQNAVVLGAQSAIDGALSGITGALQGLAAAQNASNVATLSYAKTLAGDRPEDVAAIEASVTSARGTYLAALARLETALVRTPIAGTVSVFGARVGSYATPGETLAVVTSASGIEIETTLSEHVAREFPKGTRARINGSIEGTVSSVEPGLDPLTKKARVHIALEKTEGLTPGEFVEVALMRGGDTNSNTQKQDTGTGELLIPLTALKVLPDGIFVFTISETNTIVAHPISEGPIVGDKMRVISGLTSDMEIVTDVRGINEGDEVKRQSD